MKDLCIRHNPAQLNIDERNLVEFGILEGFIRRINKVSKLERLTQEWRENINLSFINFKDMFWCTSESSMVFLT